MSLVGAEIGELRTMLADVVAGNISTDDVRTRLKIYKATAERERMILDMLKLSTLKGLSMGKITKTGIFNDNESLPDSATNRAGELVSCPAIHRLLTREECLDFSGEQTNIDQCSSCHQFRITRSLLLNCE